MLAKKPTEISLYEIINVLEATTKLNRCLEVGRFTMQILAGIAAVLLLKIVRYGPFTVSYRA